MEEFSTNTKELERRNAIEARAKFDARICAERLKNKSPDEVPEDFLTMLLETDVGEDVTEKTMEELDLDAEEFEKYIQHVKGELIRIMSKGDREKELN